MFKSMYVTLYLKLLSEIKMVGGYSMKRTLIMSTLILSILVQSTSLHPLPKMNDFTAPEWVNKVSSNLLNGTNNIGAGLKSIAQGSSELFLQGSSIFAYAQKYPRIAALTSILAGTAAGYLAYCRWSSNSWKEQIEKAQSYTDFLAQEPTDQIGKPDHIMLWRNTKNEWERPEDILGDVDNAYSDFKHDKKRSSESEIDFITRMKSNIKSEKIKLNAIKASLHECLQESHIVPSLQKRTPWVKSMIDTKVKVYQKAGVMNLTKKQEQAIAYDIDGGITKCLLSPYTVLRQSILPQEASAQEQYWKICLLLSRLEALEEMLKIKQAQIK